MSTAWLQWMGYLATYLWGMYSRANIFKRFFAYELQVFGADSEGLGGVCAYRFEETNYKIPVPVTSRGHLLRILYGLAGGHSQTSREHFQ